MGPVGVELRPRARSCPFRATVFHDEGKWWVLADRDEEPKELFRVLCHEAAHVVLGHARGSVSGRLQVARSFMEGGPVPAAGVGAVYADVAEAKGTGRQNEIDADRWADDQVDRWWIVLETVDKTVKATVENLFKGG